MEDINKMTEALAKTLDAYKEILKMVELQQTMLADMKDYVMKRDKIYKELLDKLMSSLTAR